VDQVLVDHIMVEQVNLLLIQQQTQVPQNMVMLEQIIMLLILEAVAVVPVKLDPVLMLEGEDNYQQHIEIPLQQLPWEHRVQIQEDSILQVVVPPIGALLATPDLLLLGVVEEARMHIQHQPWFLIHIQHHRVLLIIYLMEKQILVVVVLDLISHILQTLIIQNLVTAVQA
jgi:hypothetical protein